MAALTIADRPASDGEAWHGEGAVTLRGSHAGATCLALGARAGGSGRRGGRPGRDRVAKSSPRASTPCPKGELILRGDSVGFPPGGCAYLHRHQGPGIRCLIEGGIRIDTHGRSTSYGPGGAWYESGPDAVFAQAAADRPSRFIRVMILPRELIGKSSIQYVNEDDKTKPRVQQYRIFADAPIARPAE